jgi:hypothetical protein
MSKKLLEDPAVAALVEKQTAAAVKDTTKKVVSMIKEMESQILGRLEDKLVKKTVKDDFKNLLADIKEAA